MDFRGKNTEVGCHFLLQRIFLTQALNLGLLLCRWILYQLSHQGIVQRVYGGGFPSVLQTSCNSEPSSLQPNDPVTNICQAADKQLFTLVEWAKRIPHFSSLPLDDQVILLRAGQ